jgi:hypothetical protein
MLFKVVVFFDEGGADSTDAVFFGDKPEVGEIIEAENKVGRPLTCQVEDVQPAVPQGEYAAVIHARRRSLEEL